MQMKKYFLLTGYENQAMTELESSAKLNDVTISLSCVNK